jgi:hypothetical protein
MKLSKAVPLVLLGLSLCVTLLVPNARADEWNQATLVTFSEPVQIPGYILDAGTYLFILADNNSNRNIVRIFSADRSVLYATVMTISCERSDPSDDTLIALDERPSDQPQAVWKWFYPGRTIGHEFVYPAFSYREESRHMTPSSKIHATAVREGRPPRS